MYCYPYLIENFRFVLCRGANFKLNKAKRTITNHKIFIWVGPFLHRTFFKPANEQN